MDGQLAGVPPNIWNMLGVDQASRMAATWASWPLAIRKKLITMAKVDTGDHPMTIPWGTLDHDQQQAILRVLRGIRQLYVACNLTYDWRICAANIVEVV